jgi:DNA-binding MarR family transcriptional regulator
MVTIQDVLARTLATMKGDDTDMPLSQRAILLAVADSQAGEKGIYLAELADMLDCSSSTVTRAIDRLVDAGLITRRDHPTSKRRVATAVTAKGLALIESILAIERQSADELA